MRDDFRAWPFQATGDGGRIARAWARSTLSRQLDAVVEPHDLDPADGQRDVVLGTD